MVLYSNPLKKFKKWLVFIKKESASKLSQIADNLRRRFSSASILSQYATIISLPSPTTRPLTRYQIRWHKPVIVRVKMPLVNNGRIIKITLC